MNQGKFYSRFNAVVLLSAPLDVILERVGSRETNDFGKTAEERTRIVSDVATVEPPARWGHGGDRHAKAAHRGGGPRPLLHRRPHRHPPTTGRRLRPSRLTQGTTGRSGYGHDTERVRDSFVMSPYGERPAAAITSPTNPRVKELVSLRKRRTRDMRRVTLLEGYDELRLALTAGVLPLNLFVCPELVADQSRLALADEAASRGSEVVQLAAAAFAKASYRQGPDGWLAVVPDPSRPLADLTLSEPSLVLVCEGVEKPGNLGAMLRTAEAAGVDAVIAADPAADWGNPNVVRASKGTVFAVPVAAAESPVVRDWLRSRKVRTVVATPDGDQLITDVDLTVATAIVVGAEHEGVSEEWVAAADDTARLPMFGHVNSLNVAASAAVAIYEALRQRS